METLRQKKFRIYYGPADDPLHNFYIPALSSSVRYDRSAGFFSSSALAVAAEGIAHLIQNGGRMRLLVGAALTQADVEAIRQGHDLRQRLSGRLLDCFSEPLDSSMERRLQALAWMVADDALEIRVVLPRDADGLPLPASIAEDYFHAKHGIFTDAEGDQIAFSGSVNESATGWKKNYENFSVYFSWNETKAYLAQVRINFDRLWRGTERDWIALDIPTAVRDELLRYRPYEPPVVDPLERKQVVSEIAEPTGLDVTEISQAERLKFQFLRDAPYLPDAAGLGAATAAFEPWPHQSQVAATLLERFPERALLCDEVGLGKTIEAGLVIRQLVISGWVRRGLILTPKSVLKQWQEELYEKFALDVPRYDAGRFWDHAGQPLEIAGENPWDEHRLMLVGSQLAKRKDRREQFLVAQDWDLLVVDEAHHARRRDFKERIYRPNRMLGLLNDLKEHEKFAALMLLTATPMQVHPLEVWDLLMLLGMGGRWAAHEDNFLQFFTEMRKPVTDIEWEFVFDLVGDYLASVGDLDQAFAERVREEIGLVKWNTLVSLPQQHGQRRRLIRQLGRETWPHAKELARRHTPLNHYLFRNTRDLLREYQRRGLLQGKVPRRKPQRVRIRMRAEEESLYLRIEDYIANFYHKYESERRGLGFVMTVYRRRLTSSFYAVRRSLERRLEFLEGTLAVEEAFDNDDIEQDELDMDVTEEVLTEVDRVLFLAELEYVRNFIRDLKHLSVADSKLEHLIEELNQVFLTRPSVLVFTQYTDTMDYLREQLVQVYGSQVACYSGRGGEIWDGMAWVETTKEAVKNAFREGQIRILLGTESASEGLNLQTCGVLINYDMPWNPMRVEQRIGRIDRIGQTYDEVWISNYFYQDTIEDRIYQRLADRIDWFQVVVGNLQPILAKVSEATRRLAMIPVSEREAQFEKEIEALRQRLREQEVEGLNIDAFLTQDNDPSKLKTPVRLQDIEALLTQSEATGWRFKPHADISEAYLIYMEDGEWPVTFSPACFDAHPDTLRFLSFGSPLLKQVLETVPPPTEADGARLQRLRTEGGVDLRGWYGAAGTNGRWQPIRSIAELNGWLEASLEGRSDSVQASIKDAWEHFNQQVEAVFESRRKIIELRRKAEYLALRAKGQRLLVTAALVELALGKKPGLFEREVYPVTFNEQAVIGLQRHGYPWGALLSLAYESDLIPQEDDSYFGKIVNDSRESLKSRFAQLKQQAEDLVERLAEKQQTLQSEEEETTRLISTTY